jgi:hypothetical protein
MPAALRQHVRYPKDLFAMQQPMQPYNTITRLPGESNAEFIQRLPLTPRQKDNLAAWLVDHSDGEHCGRQRVFQFPTQKLIFTPRKHGLVAS